MSENSNFGFLTIAFGKSYRRIAKNLILSFRAYGNTAPFCVVTDKKDNCLKSFDYILVTKPLSNGFMNKLYLNEYSPFEHTVFLDADCLIFNDISMCFEKLMNNESAFSPMGKNYVISELSQRVGYFDFEKTKDFKIKYTYVFNGGFYYFNKNSSAVFATAQKIASSKHDYGFPFTGDEPCLALSMATHNCKCWENPNIKGMSWFPRAKNMSIDVKNGQINYQFGEKININKTDIVHFGTFNTFKPFYKSVVWTIKHKNNKLALFLYKMKVIYSFFYFLYLITHAYKKTINFIKRGIRYILRITKLSKAAKHEN